MRAFIYLGALLSVTLALRLRNNKTVSMAKFGHLDTTTQGKRAYIMMGMDPDHMPMKHLWGVLPIAHFIRENSGYPLVVLTNTTVWPDGTSVPESLAKLGVEVLPVRPLDVPEHILNEHRLMPCETDKGGSREECDNHFLKLQIFGMTDFDKLIWMDSDAMLVHSIDRLFDLEGTWAQQDNWNCGSWVFPMFRWSDKLSLAADWVLRRLPHWGVSERQSGNYCSGMVVLEPSQKTFEGLVSHLHSMPSTSGDQQVQAEYFGGDAKLLDVTTASFGQCVGRAIPGEGTPDYIHKSHLKNPCFTARAQASECNTELGRHWRKHFCGGAKVAGIGGAEVEGLCGPDVEKHWESL